MRLDDESKRLWEEFRRTETRLCCRRIIELKRSGITHLIYYIGGEPVCSVEIKYCPACGRKI